MPTKKAKKRLKPGDPRHGTDNGYCHWGCRCKRCIAAHSAAWQRWSRNPNRGTLRKKRKKAPHGSIGRYRYWGCRCHRCTAANSAYHLKMRRANGRMSIDQWKAKRRSQAVKRRRHGTEYCYKNGCQRAECRRAATRARRERRQLQAAVSRHKKSGRVS